MRQGADRAALRERKDDHYQTPACATETLARQEALPSLIWEPCAGRGAISRVLEGLGHTVVKTDLVPYPDSDPGILTHQDFLMTYAAPSQCRTIVTNPPFKLADEFIDHGLRLGCRVIVLLRMMAVEGVDGSRRGSGLRSRLVDQHLSHIWLGRERLPMMHREGWEGPKHSNSGAPFGWFVFDPHPHPPAFGFRVLRTSWRA